MLKAFHECENSRAHARPVRGLRRARPAAVALRAGPGHRRAGVQLLRAGAPPGGARPRFSPTKRLRGQARLIAARDPVAERAGTVLAALRDKTGETTILGKR